MSYIVAYAGQNSRIFNHETWQTSSVKKKMAIKGYLQTGEIYIVSTISDMGVMFGILKIVEEILI